MGKKAALIDLFKKSNTKSQNFGGAAHVFAFPDRRIPTGSIKLDAAMSGGVRAGSVCLFWGEKSGGKTTTTLRICGFAQNLCRRCYREASDIEAHPPTDGDSETDRWWATGKCDCYAADLWTPDPPPIDTLIEEGYLEKKVNKGSKAHKEALEAWDQALKENSYDELVVVWLDLENCFDKAWAEKLGLDCRRLMLAWPDSAEEVDDFMCNLIDTGEADLIVTDSVAHLTPRKEIETSAEEWQQGLIARIFNRAIRKWTQQTSNTYRHTRYPITQIWINQSRMKIGVMFGSPDTTPGGKGQEFANAVEINFRHGKTEVHEEQYGSKDETHSIPVWEEIKWRIMKFKGGGGIGQMGGRGSYRQQMRDTDGSPAGAILEEETVFKLAMYYLVSQEEKKGGKYKLGDREYQSQKAIMKDLSEDPELYSNVRQMLVDIMMKQSRHASG